MGGRGGASHRSTAGGMQYERFDVAAFDALRKQMAYDFPNRHVADQFYRRQLDAIWDGLTDMQKYAIWQYTSGSGGLNRPLSGYQGTWSNYVGTGRVPWDSENRDHALPSYFAQLTGSTTVRYDQSISMLTEAIQKSRLDSDAYLYRGSDISGLAGILRDTVGFQKVQSLFASGNEVAIKNALIGKEAQSHAFLSTAIAKEAGFSGSIRYKIYAPKGTRAIYAEPQSAYGNTIMGDTLYKKGMSYSGVGGEAEVIIQRGTKYRITGVERIGYEWRVTMEIIEQPKFKRGTDRTK